MGDKLYNIYSYISKLVLIQHNPMHSGERYRTSGPLVLLLEGHLVTLIELITRQCKNKLECPQTNPIANHLGHPT